MSRAAGAIRVVRSRVKKIRPQRQALTFTPAAITKLQVNTEFIGDVVLMGI